MQIRIRGFDDQIFNILKLKKISYFYIQKLQFIYASAYIKDVEATGEPFSPQKRTSTSRGVPRGDAQDAR
jgi:hypothetical protein